MEERRVPLHFANRLVRHMVDNAAGEDMIIQADDYTALRVLFRHAGGSWEKLSQGDLLHSRLLTTIVKAWAKMPGRQRQPEVV